MKTMGKKDSACLFLMDCRIKNICLYVSFDNKNASAGNRTRVDSLEGYNSTSKLLMLLTSLLPQHYNSSISNIKGAYEKHSD